jgi:hypothetical protein
MDALRARAVIRDEGRLRSALAVHGQRRFDVDSARMVLERVEDLLETVGLVVQDDDFWDRLTDIDRPPSLQQLERVRELDNLAFAALLEAAGYTAPPPPPADELVDDTIKALMAAATVTQPHVAAERVKNARSQLTTLTMRVRRQIGDHRVVEAAPSVLRSSARSLGRGTRWLIPRVVAGAAGGLVELYAPGVGAGFFVGRSVQHVAEDLAELAADMVIGDPQSSPEDQHIPELPWRTIDPLAVHVAALSDHLNALETYQGDAPTPPQDMAPLLYDARRHLNRLEELISDNAKYMDERVADRILILRRTLEAASLANSVINPRPVEFKSAIHALGWLRHRL